jgi:hypothetical protein
MTKGVASSAEARAIERVALEVETLIIYSGAAGRRDADLGSRGA